MVQVTADWIEESDPSSTAATVLMVPLRPYGGQEIRNCDDEYNEPNENWNPAIRLSIPKLEQAFSTGDISPQKGDCFSEGWGHKFSQKKSSFLSELYYTITPLTHPSFSTWYSQVVTYLDTDQANRCLTLVIST